MIHAELHMKECHKSIIKKFLFFVSICLCVLNIVGCNNQETLNATNKESTYQNIEEEQKQPPTSSETNSFAEFTSDDLKNAQEIATSYYAGTDFIIKSIEYDEKNPLYLDYASNYEKGNLIVFTVEVKDSENPPRGIALIRKTLDGNWEVLSEGY